MKATGYERLVMESPGSHTLNGTRDRLLAGVMVAIGTLLLLCFWFFFAQQCRQTGWDFPVFYIAGSLPTGEIYSRVAFETYWQQYLAPLGVIHWARFVRLPLFAILLRPVAAIPYMHALQIWMAAGLTAYFAAISVLMRRLQLPALLLPAFAGFFPAMVGLISGQDNCLLLLGVTAAWLLFETNRDILAGIALTLCLYKFNLVLLVPLLLLVKRRYRGMAAFAAGAATVAAASFAISPIRTYLRTLDDVPKQTPGFHPVGLRGFSLAIGQPWCYPALAAIVFLLCCWLMWRLPFREGFGVAITGSLMIVPYVCWYDSTLLVIPLSIIYARSTLAVRVACVATLAAVPAWMHGGGSNGPIGFTHVIVEALILGYFANGMNPGKARFLRHEYQAV